MKVGDACPLGLAYIPSQNIKQHFGQQKEQLSDPMLPLDEVFGKPFTPPQVCFPVSILQLC